MDRDAGRTEAQARHGELLPQTAACWVQAEFRPGFVLSDLTLNIQSKGMLSQVIFGILCCPNRNTGLWSKKINIISSFLGGFKD